MRGQRGGAGFSGRERARVFRGPDLRDAPLRPLLVLRGYSSPGRVMLSTRRRCGSGEVRPSQKRGHFYRTPSDRHTHSRQLIQRHPYRTRAHLRLEDAIVNTDTPGTQRHTQGHRNGHPPGTDTHPTQMHANTNAHTQKRLLLPDGDTDMCSQSPSEVRTCSARTHGLSDAQTCSENTQTHTQARQTDPQTQPFICSRDSCGTPPVCQVPSGVRNTSNV